ncbi:hypothetical protein C1645_820747 [Glomus cerebriforme]|uniref:Uncharacterized protein n=1 Tax=Glomus cerebriforme TaxID=658196 RepID=A0A397T2L6_9GLOM|nr:hypothetical protein C1645_820747 [Glomus cerebriforme]
MFDDSLILNSPTIGQDMDVDKDGKEVITQPDASSKKQANESTSVNKPSKRAKISGKEGSPKKIHTRGDENRIFFDLYLKISKAEKQNGDSHHELIIAYYHFGEELEKHLIQYNHLKEHEAQKKVNNKVKDQLPKEVTKPTI